MQIVAWWLKQREPYMSVELACATEIYYPSPINFIYN
jgi:hypothetical protein